jgi:hypothetical protein
MSNPALGTAIIEPSLLRVLESLWEGPLRPADLPLIERAIRAFPTAPALVLSRYERAWDSPASADRPWPDYNEPFDDQLLDYEFSHPREPHPCAALDSSESSFLEELVLAKISSEAAAALPVWIKTEGQAMAFLDAWYKGDTPNQIETEALAEIYWDEWLYKPFKGIERLGHAVFVEGGRDHAEYLVGCHRAGLTVYGCSPVAQICSEHIFSKCPDHLFKTLDDEYRRSAEELRGPGLGLCLPPVTSLLLSRSPSRYRIPETLRDLREEYERARSELWTMLGEMWNAPSFKAQLTVLRKLEGAASALFKTAFPEAIEALSVALTATKLLRGDPISPLEKLHEWNKPRVRVGAVTFAAKLSADLRANLLNHRNILRRHLADWELREFGAMP